MLERASKSRAVSAVMKNTEEKVATDGFKDRIEDSLFLRERAKASW
jgi:hypothetical protein